MVICLPECFILGTVAILDLHSSQLTATGLVDGFARSENLLDIPRAHPYTETIVYNLQYITLYRDIQQIHRED